MYEKEKKSLKAISQYAGARLDYVQGGGGNTSYKFDDHLMGIKASGYSMLEVEEEKGYVIVDYAALKQEYMDLSRRTGIDLEKETLNINLKCIRQQPYMENRRPSVEVGFHSFLKRAVIHTHSVYSNIICCSQEGEYIAQEIFGCGEFGYFLLPFINPGFALSMYVEEKIRDYKVRYGKYPDLIFMENHGIIASHDEAEQAMQIHEKANDMIARYFACQEYPQPKILEASGTFKSDTPFLKEFIRKRHADEKYWDTIILYPDQIVYLGENLGNTIKIDTESGAITYHMGQKQAQVTEEVMLGVAYIITVIERVGLTLKLLCEAGIDFIRNWESEKYRASLAAKQ